MAGWFASYHVYPYYPDFMLYDPGYNRGRSSMGRSNYYGYLQDLLQHHAGIPVIISEFGIPTSRGNAHLQPQGWHHGGVNEQDAAIANARLAAEIREVGAAGAVVFAWIDEWFKRNWFSMDFEQPAERGRLWHNILSPEQHYGLVALRPGAPGTTPALGGDPARWRATAGAAARHAARARQLDRPRGQRRRLRVPRHRDAAPRGTRTAAGIRCTSSSRSTRYKPELGQFVLPTSGLRSGTGFEFLVEFLVAR